MASLFGKSGIAAIEHDLADAQRRLENLEVRRENLATEHSRAVEERRALLLNDNDDLKLLSKVDIRVSNVEGALAGIEDALNVQRGKIADLTNKLDQERGKQDRESKAAEIEALGPPIHQKYLKAEAAVKEFVAACRAAGSIPEAVRVADWVDQQFLKTVPPELAFISEIIKGQAAALRNPPHPTPAAEPKPQPTLSYPALASDRPHPAKVGAA
jgi:DNA repair exonuclease SbcCD ATPase subunit